MTGLLLILTLLGQPVFALASLYGSLSGDSTVKEGRSFSIKADIKNNGSSPAYCVKLIIKYPNGFSGKSSVGLGDINVGKSKSYKISIKAPKMSTTGTISMVASYFDTINCTGSTSLVSSVGSWTVKVISSTTIKKPDTIYNVTFKLLSTSGHLTSAFVVIYDSAGNNVAGTGGTSDCSTCPIYAKVKLPSGTYKAVASGKVDTAGGQQNALGEAKFSVVSKDKSVTINLKPFPWYLLP